MDFNDDNENDIPDWLKDLGADEGEQKTPPAGEPPEDEMADWLDEVAAGEPAEPLGEPEEEVESPDWLAEIRSAEQSGRAPREGEDDEEAWLDGIRGQFEAEYGPIEEKEEPEDFLESLQSFRQDEPQEDAKVDFPEEREDPVEKLAEQDGELPDWVSGLPAMDPPAPFEREGSPDQDEDEDETPPWLKSVREQAASLQSLEDFPAGEEDDLKEEPVEPPGPPPGTGSLPPWMESLQTSGLVMPSEPSPDEQLEGAGYSEEELSQLFEDEDLPDWLGAEEGFVSPPPEEPDEIKEAHGEIEKGEMPGWLQAIHPFEAVTEAGTEKEEEGEGETERFGPLSGLTGVLPAEPHIVHFGSPPSPVPRFELTEAQRKNAGILAALIETEDEPVPAERRTMANPQQILRWVIAILLLSVTFAMVWVSNVFTLPGLDPAGMPAENLAVISQVNELTADDAVLLAFEYQPGLTGELQAASSALVRHLLMQDAQFVLVSSQPVGPGLGEAYLQQGFSDDLYISGREYANLGYVSGGAAGLLGFATDMRGTSGSASWDEPPLANIQSIQDFSLVVVLTDDPDMARSWVEQVQPLLDPDGDGQGVPLVMVVSAQAEPMVYPYYATSPRQIAGLIGGIGGGAYYETVIDEHTAGRYWDAYNVGLLLAVIVIAVGSIFNLARNSLESSRRMEGVK